MFGRSATIIEANVQVLSMKPMTARRFAFAVTAALISGVAIGNSSTTFTRQIAKSERAFVPPPQELMTHKIVVATKLRKAIWAERSVPLRQLTFTSDRSSGRVHSPQITILPNNKRESPPREANEQKLDITPPVLAIQRGRESGNLTEQLVASGVGLPKQHAQSTIMAAAAVSEASDPPAKEVKVTTVEQVVVTGPPPKQPRTIDQIERAARGNAVKISLPATKFN